MAHLPKLEKAFKTSNCTETESLAKRLSLLLKCGDLIMLKGELGVGKTAFARALIQELSHKKEEVVSPTFTLVQVYDTTTFQIYHYDFYRIQRFEEIEELGFEEAVASGVVLVEWPCRLEDNVPQLRLEIEIKQGVKIDDRDVQFFGDETWAQRIKQEFN